MALSRPLPAFTPLTGAIRALAIDAVQKANSGHPGMPMGMADVATVLYTRFLKFDATAPRTEQARTALAAKPSAAIATHQHSQTSGPGHMRRAI